VGVFGAVAISSAAQTASGFGFALIATPLVAVLVGPKEAVVGLTMVGVLLTAWLSLRAGGHVHRRIVLVVTAFSVCGMPLGLLVLTRTEDRVLTVIIALVVIAFTVLLWRGLRLPVTPATDALAGFTAGIISTSTGTSGPPIVIALASRAMAPAEFRRTISAIFLVQSSASLVAFALGGQVTSGAFSVAAAGVPALVVGTVVGERGFRRLDAAAFRRVVFGMLLLSGIVSLVGAILT
jgi:hypothetical protein